MAQRALDEESSYAFGEPLTELVGSRNKVAIYRLGVIAGEETENGFPVRSRGLRARTVLYRGELYDPESIEGRGYVGNGGRMLEVVVSGEGFSKARAKIKRLLTMQKEFRDQKPSLLLTGTRHPYRRRKKKKPSGRGAPVHPSWSPSVW